MPTRGYCFLFILNLNLIGVWPISSHGFLVSTFAPSCAGVHTLFRLECLADDLQPPAHSCFFFFVLLFVLRVCSHRCCHDSRQSASQQTHTHTANCAKITTQFSPHYRHSRLLAETGEHRTQTFRCIFDGTSKQTRQQQQQYKSRKNGKKSTRKDNVYAWMNEDAFSWMWSKKKEPQTESSLYTPQSDGWLSPNHQWYQLHQQLE